MQDRRFISLVVATLGRHEELARLLASLACQTWRDFEVIVVDQNPEGFLDDVVTSYRDRLPHLRWLRTVPRGVSAARNAGLAVVAPQATILGFPDDDCWYEPDTLENVVAALVRHSGVGAVLGQGGGDRQRFRTGKEVQLNRYSIFNRGGTWTYFVAKGNTDLLYDEAIGPGTGLPYGCGEDTDYLIAVLQTGSAIWRCPSIHLHHPDAAPSFSWRKLSSYARGRQYVLRKWRYPLWFQVLNVVYPLMALVRRPGQIAYRFKMFVARLLAIRL